MGADYVPSDFSSKEAAGSPKIAAVFYIWKEDNIPGS